MGKKKKKTAAGKRKPEQPAAKKPTRKKNPSAKSQSATTVSAKPGFAVVGLGASAGGLDAFKQFFTAMPSDTDMAFVLIQHLDPTHESLTAELLGKQTRMSVVQVTDSPTVEAERKYMSGSQAGPTRARNNASAAECPMT